MKTILALAALALLAAPATAAVIADTNDVSSALPEPANQLASGLGRYYAQDDGSVWMESNGIAGLQTQAGTTESGAAFEADTLVQGVPALAIPEPPALPA